MNKKEKKPKEQKTEEQRMDYEAFTQEMAARIRQHAGTGTEVNLKDMAGNNGTFRKGAVIQEKGQNTAPIIYLEPYYARYLESAEVDELAEEAYTVSINNRHPENLDVSILQDYKKVKERVLFKLVNYKWNEKLLKEVSHRKYLDLAVVFYCPLAKEEGQGAATVLIRKEHLGFWGITEEELAERAYENTPRLLKHQLLDMAQLLRGLLSAGKEWSLPAPEAGEPEMLVLTSRNRINGAACMLYPGLLEEIAAEKNASLIILPSSIHEVILLPVPEGVEKDRSAVLAQMIKEVNRTQVAAEEALSDHAYFYDRSRKEVCPV